ncbi:hypothetical protein BGZ97_008535, partial [Linnemannia gamsii]
FFTEMSLPARFRPSLVDSCVCSTYSDTSMISGSSTTIWWELRRTRGCRWRF